MINDTSKPTKQQQVADFEKQAVQRQHGMIFELLQFMLHNKKWWLTPIILFLLLLGIILVLGGTGAAPFIYTLF